MCGPVQPMVISPDKRFLYVGVRPEFRVLAYRISPDDGALTYTAEAPLPGSQPISQPIVKATLSSAARIMQAASA